MDGLCDLLQKSHRAGIKYNEKIDGLEVSEIYAHEGSINFRTRKIPEDKVVAWLSRTDVVDDKSHDILRMVFVSRWIKSTCESWEDEISHKNQDLVLDYFDLKKTYQLVADGSIICLPMPERHGNTKQHFALATFGHAGTLIWTYDLIKAQTDVIWMGDDRLFPFSLSRPVLESHKHLAKHPMFMALVAALCSSQSTQVMIEPICKKINQVENRTLHCPANLLLASATGNIAEGNTAEGNTAEGNTAEGNTAEGNTAEGNTAEGNYAALSARMSGCATRLAGFDGRHRNLDDIFDAISAYKWPQGIEQPDWAETIVPEINESVSILKARTRGQEQRVRYLSQRADIQLTALFNLIAQQETRISISVAEDSRMLARATKEDSTAMRTLAAVTVFFLPGTFVAAVFSMPLFDWDAQTGATSTVISKRLWIYWAFAGPLTLGTLAVWFIWTRLQTRRRRTRDSEGKEAFYREMDAPQQEYTRFMVV